MRNKITAVEWLATQLEKYYGNQDIKNTTAFLRAKQMEEEQIKDAYGDGINGHRTDFCDRDEYFVKTFGDVL